jgi:hypothetical protein
MRGGANSGDFQPNKEDNEVTDFLHAIRSSIELPLWAEILALAFVAVSPLVVVKWRKAKTWHRSDR